MKRERGRFAIPVALMEFDEGGNTIWVHSPNGATVLRVKCSGKITMDRRCTNAVTHVDVLVPSDVNICRPSRTPPSGR